MRIQQHEWLLTTTGNDSVSSHLYPNAIHRVLPKQSGYTLGILSVPSQMGMVGVQQIRTKTSALATKCGSTVHVRQPSISGANRTVYISLPCAAEPKWQKSFRLHKHSRTKDHRHGISHK